ncbi:MAG: transcriptional regulator PadR family protein [Bacillota bacterium]|nr:MAG: transcriptional regulator PadR family protein [Bacillota bacterium]
MAREQLKNLTEPMYYLLLALTTPQHGYGIMQEVDRKTMGRVKIGAGTLYSLLSRFEKEDIIHQLSDDSRKKTYQLTAKGFVILREEFERLNQLVRDGKKHLEGIGDSDEI